MKAWSVHGAAAVRALTFCLLLATACAGEIDDRPRATGSAGATGADDPRSKAAESPPSANEVEAARARCAEPEGEVNPYTTWAGMRERANGRWLFCDQTGSETMPYESLELDFTGMRWYRLVASPDGSLQRKAAGSLQCNHPDRPGDGDGCNYLNLYDEAVRGTQIVWMSFFEGPRSMRLGFVSTASRGRFVPL